MSTAPTRVAIATAAVILVSTATAAVEIPGPDDPVVTVFYPPAAQQGELLFVFGFNLGTAPEVRFSNGTLAPQVAYRPDLGALVLRVPPGADSGNVTITNNDTSETFTVEDFTVLAGVFPQACTIAGTITTDAMAPLQGALIVAEDADELPLGVTLTDVAGNYTVDLPASGSYEVRVIPPLGSPHVEALDSVACPTVHDRQLAAGFRLEGRIRSASGLQPLEHAYVLVEGGGVDGSEFATGADGRFHFFLPAGTYEIFVDGPIGGTFLSQAMFGISVAGDVDVGDIDLATGSRLSGEARVHDGDASGVIPEAELELFDAAGFPVGSGQGLADGRFFAVAVPGSGYRVRLFGEDAVSLDVRSIDLSTDLDLPDRVDVYTSAPQSSELPLILEIDETFQVRAGQPMALELANATGSLVDVLFADGFGGFVDGDDTVVDGQRSFAMTRVPPGAATGEIALRVDGVTGPGVPVVVEPGFHTGGPFTVGGTVTDGSGPVAGAIVLLFRVTCIDEVIDYTVTDPQGRFVLTHGGQGAGFFMGVVPPAGSGVPFASREPHLTGDEIEDFVLPVGHAVSGRVVDSGLGPVGAAGLPVEGAFYDIESTSGGEGEAGQTDANGTFDADLAPDLYGIKGEPPFLSRYLRGSEVVVNVSGPGNLGDFPIDSGFLVAGRVVDTLANGLAGVEVEARASGTFDAVARVQTRASGGFRLAVPAGTYDLAFIPHDTLFVTIPGVFGLDVTTDTVVHPPVVGVDAAFQSPGPVPDGDAVPADALTVATIDPGTGELAIGWTAACDATDHALYVGELGDFTSYTDALCSIGVDGFESFVAPPGDLFFLVVGTHAGREGSYGTTSAGVERTFDASGLCGRCQDLRATCGGG